jgi:hypothetical protein
MSGDSREEEARESLASIILKASNDPKIRDELFTEMEMSVYSVTQDDLDKRFTV